MSTPGAMAQQSPSAQAVIVVDGSNSMWTQIDGNAKTVIANEAISTILRRRAADLMAGVLAYGSREQNSCTDVATVVPYGPYDGDAITAGLSAIAPKGATPIALALETATETLPDGPGTIVLIADGLDNCSGDPCAIASALKAANPDVVLHVIGFSEQSSAPESLAPLACISDAGGGSFTIAGNGPELLSALETALTARSTNVTSAEAGTAPSETPPLDIAEVAENGTSFLRMSDNGVPLPPMRPDPNAPDQRPLGTSVDADLPSTSESEATIADEDRPRRPARLWAQLTDDTGAIPSDLVWRVFAINPHNPGAYELYETSEDAQPQFTLPEGRYVVHVGYGRAYATLVLEVDQSAIEQALVLDAGGLRIRQIGADERDLPRGQSQLAVYSPEQDEYGQRRLLLREMPPGSIIRLNAGTYHVVSQYGDSNSVVRSDVRVQPGLLTDAWISHHAATITLKLVTEIGGEALANTAWSILSPGGDVVKESFGAFPTHVLAAGEYSVHAPHEGQLYNREFTVSAGEVREIELLAE